MESWSESLNQLVADGVGKEYLWILDVFLVVLLTLVAAAVFSRFLNRLEQKALSTHNLWDDALVQSLQRPAKWFIWGLGITTAADIAAAHSPSALLESVDTLRHLGAILIITWFLNGFISRAEENLMSTTYSHKPMGCGDSISVRTASMAASWSGVSSNGKPALNWLYTSLGLL